MTYTLEQQKANRKLWIEALRSGKYQQGRYYLKIGDSYCCLGVLSVLAGAPTIEPHPVREAIDWVGLTNSSGWFDNGCLVNLNDGGTSFAEIADIIESEPKGLFVESVE